MEISRQTKLIAALGVIDLITTLAFVTMTDAGEANPLMASFLSHSLLAFILAKSALLIGPLAVLEWARRIHPVFVTRAANMAVAAYVCLYGAGVVRANTGPDYQHLPPQRLAQGDRVWNEIQAAVRRKREQTMVWPTAARKALPASGPAEPSLFVSVEQIGRKEGAATAAPASVWKLAVCE